MFWKQAISDMENGIKNHSGTGKDTFCKVQKEKHGHRVGSPLFKKKKLFLYRYFKRPASFKNLKKKAFSG